MKPLDTEQFLPDQSPTLPIPDHKIVENWCQIRFRNQIGSGSFGDDFTALFRCEVVTVKILCKPSMKKMTVNNFVEDVQVLYVIISLYKVYCCGYLSSVAVPNALQKIL